MFTGIVEEVGEILAVDAGADVVRLTVRGPTVSSDARHGDSIAVSGVCLTVTDTEGTAFTVELVPETLRRTSLSALGVGGRVNLERAVALGDRLGGHIVQGHVDGTATVLSRTPGERSDVVRFSLAPELARYVVLKGSITVEGVSLTIVEAGADSFTVALIPTTLADTTLGHRPVGDLVNIEVDVLAKYVERLTSPHLAAAARPDGDNGLSEGGE